MAARTVDLAVLRRVVRLRLEAGHGPMEISRATGISRSTVQKYLGRLLVAHVTTERALALTDAELAHLLLPTTQIEGERPEPDWARVHLELRRAHVTKALLWQEYREEQPQGYEYSRFCELYARWTQAVPPTMRQLHVPGERMFVDFSGSTIAYTDAATGDVRDAKLFLAVLGGSSLSYAEPVPDESLPSWVACHVRALEFFGGVSRLWVPDNLKSGVTKADRYEPLVNRTYEQLADHYGASVLPARAQKPRDKAKVEAAVKVANRWILAALRNRRFGSLAELRVAVRALIEKINAKVMRALGRSRRELFEQSEKGALLPLPPSRYEWCEWARWPVGTDYHVIFDDHAYSVPHRLGGHTLDIRATGTIVEILDGRGRVACHVRARHVGGKTTLPEHMPASHRAHAEWTPERIKLWATTMGPSVALFVEEILRTKPHPEHGYRACLGLKGLTRRYPQDRVEAACARALRVRALSITSVRSILLHNLDREQLAEDRGPLPVHENVRGPDYYD